MTIKITSRLLKEIHTHGENAYPEEGAGLLLGSEQDGFRSVLNLLKLDNSREKIARHNRYLITARDMLQGEKEAEQLGLSIVGIFHSHPDHPNLPSEFDREWAIPWYSYLITSIQNAEALDTRCWRLLDDRSSFSPEEIIISQEEN
ncbi:MAG: M67 family metallopeptidase [Anaerolineales bacterium]